MSTVQANLHEAKTNLSKLVAKALDGDEVVIAKAGHPLVKLVPLVPHKKRKPGQLKGKYVIPDDFFEPLTEKELADWE